MTGGFVRAIARRTRLERSLLFEALWLLVAARVTLRVLPFPLVRRWLAGRARPARAGGPTPEQVSQAVRAVGARVRGTTCLAEAVACHALLLRHGHAAALRIGIRRGGGGLAAHAWVECNGAIAIGTVPDLSDYAVLSESASRASHTSPIAGSRRG
jgi:hypothetical protein